MEISSEIPSKIWTDSRRLMQILINLMSNALKYTHKGYIKLEA